MKKGNLEKSINISKGFPILCCYKDKKANIYTAPMTFANQECAIRHFEKLAESNPNVTDFDLYMIGFYSETFGCIELLPNHEEKMLLKSGDEFSSQVDTILNLKKSINLLIDDDKKKTKIILALEDEIKKSNPDFNLDLFTKDFKEEL